MGTRGGGSGRSAAVVGAGVIGLTAALQLCREGWEVRVVTDRAPSATTSSVAAALWYPYRAAPRELILGWSARTMTVLSALAADPATGVRLLPCRELGVAPDRDPWWEQAVPDFRRCRPEEVPGGAPAWEFTAPVADTSRYLPWLLRSVEAAGAVIERRHVGQLGELAGTADLVVNCAGLGARELVADEQLVPVRGQVVIVEDPGLPRVWLDQSVAARPTYIVPRGADCVLGGTAEAGAEGLVPDPDVAEDILGRCAALEPQLDGARVLGHRVGLRPARPTVRLEREETPSGPIVHAYGHGGAGITLSWGCAEDIARLASGGG